MLGLKERSRFYVGLIKEEEFIFCLWAAETSRSSATGGLRGRERASHPNIKEHPDADGGGRSGLHHGAASCCATCEKREDSLMP